jgi:hypothetical protein
MPPFLLAVTAIGKVTIKAGSRGAGCMTWVFPRSVWGSVLPVRNLTHEFFVLDKESSRGLGLKTRNDDRLKTYPTIADEMPAWMEGGG